MHPVSITVSEIITATRIHTHRLTLLFVTFEEGYSSSVGKQAKMYVLIFFNFILFFKFVYILSM